MRSKRSVTTLAGYGIASRMVWTWGGRGQVGRAEQVPALDGVEPQRARDGVEHLDAGVDRPSLFQPGVPGDADPGELRHLLAAQSRGPAPGAGRQAGVLRADPLAAAAQERRQLGPAGAAGAHVPHLRSGAANTRITRLLVTG